MSLITPETIILNSALGAGAIIYFLLRPRYNAVVLEKIGQGYALSKAKFRDDYLLYRGAVFPIPHEYDYWVRTGRGFSRIPKWFRFFYLDNGILAEIRDVGETEVAVNRQLLSQFVRTQTLSQILRGFSLPKTTILLNLAIGVVLGMVLGFSFATWFGGGG